MPRAHGEGWMPEVEQRKERLPNAQERLAAGFSGKIPHSVRNDRQIKSPALSDESRAFLYALVTFVETVRIKRRRACFNATFDIAKLDLRLGAFFKITHLKL